MGEKGSALLVAEEAIESVEETERLKRSLADSLYGTDQGLNASSETRAEIGDLITQLESKNLTPVPTEALFLLNGKWILAYHLKDAVLEGGIPFKKASEISAIKNHGTNHRFNKVLRNGMANHSTITMKNILETYKGFESLTSLVDVGGAIGATLKMIVFKYPKLKGINFDLPHVIKDAKLDAGIEHVGGDMFVSVPKGDAMFMKICHAWSDEHCVIFLKNCYEALPEDGKVIVAECILPETPDSSLSTKQVFHVDCIMLSRNHGGKERTEKEFEALAKASGFKGIKVVCDAFGLNLIELLKKL